MELWDKNYNGKCKFTSILNGKENTKLRKLDEYEVFIRDNIGLEIIKKIKNEKNFFNEIVLPRNPYGFVSAERGQKKFFNDLELKFLLIFSNSEISEAILFSK